MPTIVAAIVAAAVATFGYLLNARVKRVEEKRAVYASALAAVSAYNELPHRIRRRSDSSPATRGALGALISDTQKDIDHFYWILYLDSARVGDAYKALVRTVQASGKKNRDAAWSGPVADRDEKMSYPENYPSRDEVAFRFCIKQMDGELRIVQF